MITKNWTLLMRVNQVVHHKNWTTKKISGGGGGLAAGTNGLLWNRLGDVKGWVNSHGPATGLMTSLIVNYVMNLGVIFRNSTCRDKSWVERHRCLPTWWVSSGELTLTHRGWLAAMSCRSSG